MLFSLLILALLLVSSCPFHLPSPSIPSRSHNPLNLAPPGPLVDALASYDALIQSNPLATKSVTAGIILGAADLTAQVSARPLKAMDNPVLHQRKCANTVCPCKPRLVEGGGHKNPPKMLPNAPSPPPLTRLFPRTPLSFAPQAASPSPIDVPRFLRFASFGLLLQAPWNHFY